MTDALPTIRLCGMEVDVVDTPGLIDRIFDGLVEGHGGWVVTANLDILRQYVATEGARELYEGADVRVADGMPLVWAARVLGQALPERVAGSSVSWMLAEQAAGEDRSIYLLGGEPEAADLARNVLQARYPGLDIRGCSSPMLACPPSDDEVASVIADLEAAQPDIVFVAMGAPKQDHLIAAVRERFPATWFIGVGATLGFISGREQRAPEWAQRLGLEWAHRLVHDPRRLARRYLVDDLPFVARLFSTARRDRLVAARAA